MRELIVIRHAIAFERDRSKWPDDEKRPLTRAGARRFRSAARGIGKAVPRPDEMLCSPLARTRQTARILKRKAGFPAAQPFDELRPQIGTAALVKALRARTADCIAIIGHEPNLQQLLCELLGAEAAAGAYAMKKGGLAWLTFVRGRGKLVAFLPPRLLRALR